ncbi:hypothetical protein BCR34DRAFT_568980 [Clohesyomyces aquaticus]|uniref:AA1-like domain-containing protein n=1 Tax=Clohesyomyces aquaticus TaxID=1231657 RepID=A0A1Y1ZFR3_9PLEO|nr:hypothetical protein BCR34DRAFT_568980 [Clohesyomyces aquaticus]
MLPFKSLLLLAFAPLILCKPSPLPAFQVTNLNTFEPTGRPGDLSPYRVGFNVTDPADATAAFCEARWPYSQRDTGFPSTHYLSNCSDHSYSFRFLDWESYLNFTLDVKHIYKKPDHTRVTKIGKGHADLNILHCTHAASGFSVCNQKDGVAFPLPIYSVNS